MPWRSPWASSQPDRGGSMCHRTDHKKILTIYSWIEFPSGLKPPKQPILVTSNQKSSPNYVLLTTFCGNWETEQEVCAGWGLYPFSSKEMRNSCPKGTSCTLEVETKATLRLSLWRTGLAVHSAVPARGSWVTHASTQENNLFHTLLSELIVQLLWFSHAGWYIENRAISKWMKRTFSPWRINSFYLQTVLPPSSVKIRRKRKSNLLKKVPGRIKTKAFSPKIRGGGWHYLSKLPNIWACSQLCKGI